MMMLANKAALASMVRGVQIALMLGFALYGGVSLILPSAKIPWLAGFGTAIGVTLLFGLLFFLASLQAQPKKGYGLTNEAVYIPVVDQFGFHHAVQEVVRFSKCLAWVLHTSENQIELFSRSGDIRYLELPVEEPLRSQILEFIQARVKAWMYAKAPNEIRVEASTLEGRALYLFWVSNLTGSVGLASSVEVNQILIENMGLYLFFGQWLFGFGAIWGWDAWVKLAPFPFWRRLNLACTISINANRIFTALFVPFWFAFNTASIVP
jgi:hypothetical protein